MYHVFCFIQLHIVWKRMHNMITELGFLNGTPVSGLHGRIFLIKMNWLVFREQVFPVVLGIYGT